MTARSVGSSLVLAACIVLAILLGGLLPVCAGTLLVVDPAGQKVTFIDTATGERRGTVATGAGPRDVAVSPDGKLALVSNYGTPDLPGNSLTLIDIPGMRSIHTIGLSPLSRPFAVRWTRSGLKAVVAVQGEGTLAVIDIATHHLEMIKGAASDEDRQLTLSSDDRHALMASPAGGKVVKIRLDDGAKVGESENLPQAESIVLSRDGRRIWVTDRGDDSVHVLDSESLAEVTNLLAGNMPMGVAITPDGRYALVSNALSSDVMVFDTSSYEQAQLFSTRSVAAVDEGSLFQTEDTESKTRLGHISIPVAIVPAEDSLSAYVMNNFSGEIVQYDIFTGAALRVFQGSRVPGGMAYSPLTAGE